MSKTILLADDSVTIQKVIELTFMDQDYSVVSVSSGDEALARLDVVQPDLVIADVHMPGASGFEVAKQSKARRPAVPVLLLVGTFEPFDEAEFTACGADQYLKKPFDSQELLRLVDELSQPAAAAAPAASTTAAPSFDFAAEPEDNASAFRLSLEDEEPLSAFGADTGSEVKPPDALAFEPLDLPAAPDALAFEDVTAEDLAGMASDDFSVANSQTFAGEGLAFELEDEPLTAAPADLLAGGGLEAGEPEVVAYAAEELSVDLDTGGLEVGGFEAGGFEGELEIETDEALGVVDVPEPAAEVYGFEAPEGLVYDLDQTDEDTAGIVADAIEIDAAGDDLELEEGGADKADTGTFEVLPADPLPLIEEPLGEDEMVLEVEEHPMAAMLATPAPPAPPVQVAPPAPAPPAASPPAPSTPAASPAAAAGSGNGRSAAQLSDEDVERIAVRVAELLSDKVARELAWEILPDLAEVVIKERLRELESQIS